jgi:aerobic-type carbon monoxide dehydrogenase small subunit (CoxS/CutS family)
MIRIEFTLNGKPVHIHTRGDGRVVDLLREELGLTGTKEACGAGECGACTVLIDDKPRPSCLTLAAQLQGRRVTTIEGLAPENGVHPMQKAFIEQNAVQCGFCSPGMILGAISLLQRTPMPSEQEVRQALAGNLCRCTGYQKIIQAVLTAAHKGETK